MQMFVLSCVMRKSNRTFDNCMMRKESQKKKLKANLATRGVAGKEPVEEAFMRLNTSLKTCNSFYLDLFLEE